MNIVKMSFSSNSYLLVFFLFSTGYFVPCVFSAPVTVPDSPYNKFIEFLVQKNCSMPKDIELPFPPSTSGPFTYLSDPLRECQTSDALKENDEAKYLCSEIFDVLQNITCRKYKILPKIQANPFSVNPCADFETMKDIFPEEKDYLSKRLADETVCKLLCLSEKYDDLCKTLLWSYDLQAKIKDASEKSEKEKVNIPKVDDDNADKIGTSSTKDNLDKKVVGEKRIVENEVVTDNKNGGNGNPSGNNGSVLNNFALESSDRRTSINDAIKSPDEIDVSSNNYPTEKSVKTSISNEIPQVTANQNVGTKTSDHTGSNKDLLPGTLEEDLLTIRNDSKLNPLATLKSNKGGKNITISSDTEVVGQSNGKFMNKPPTENVDVGNSIAGVSQLNNIEKSKNALLPVNATSSKPEISPVSDENNQKNALEIIEHDEEKQKNVITKESSDTNTKSDGNSVDTAPQDTEANELSNDSFQGRENEAKIKQANLKIADDAKERPKITDFKTPVGELSDVESKSLESTTLEMLPDKEDIEHQDDKDQEQYNDTENESDYPKSEYDNSFNPPPKNKEADRKSSDVEGTNQISNNYDAFISSRNNIGRVPDDIPVISPFPEQEDGHFFFYFLSIVLILMAGYLIFHNKQKIIALIVEGRHERRRRSHGAGYKKLETK